MNLFRRLVIGAAVVGSSQAMAFIDNIEPYAGFDLQNRHMDFKKNEGSQFFKKHYTQGNLFVGAKLHENFALELGYEQSQRKKNDVLLTAGDINLGGGAIVQPIGYKTRGKIQGFHINALGLMPLDNIDKNLSVFAGVGIAKLKAKFERQIVSFNGAPQPAVEPQAFNDKNSKYVLRLTGGVNYLFNPNVGVRGTLSYEKTSKIKPQSTLNGATRVLKLKDSVVYGLGVFYKF